jgi:hypothetical protein
MHVLMQALRGCLSGCGDGVTAMMAAKTRKRVGLHARLGSPDTACPTPATPQLSAAALSSAHSVCVCSCLDQAVLTYVACLYCCRLRHTAGGHQSQGAIALLPARQPAHTLVKPAEHTETGEVLASECNALMCSQSAERCFSWHDDHAAAVLIQSRQPLSIVRVANSVGPWQAGYAHVCLDAFALFGSSSANRCVTSMLRWLTLCDSYGGSRTRNASVLACTHDWGEMPLTCHMPAPP